MASKKTQVQTFGDPAAGKAPWLDSSLAEYKKPHRSLAEEVETAITRRISDGPLAGGNKLPTEAQLMREHGVSRTVIREALSRLQAAGLVETRHGVGTFVRETPALAHGVLTPRVLTTINDIVAMLELRISLETEAAGLAAMRRSDEDLRNMRSALDFFAAQTERGSDAVQADVLFHLHIAKATGNSYFTDFYRYMGRGAIPRDRINTAQFAEKDTATFLARTHHEHMDIYNAIVNQDVETARAAMRMHLANSKERLQQASRNPVVETE